ncbi:MAG: 3-oxoacyl-[acyl-carrier-protein] reductase [Flavobacteriales bacterium]|nr:3-oxoacyl-[acyl-carrier-protein] reductase [Flavobacteriales bacterium]MCB9192715.1 3-oxoacyl-[acyl-carrier-protein] reductase [Flavobacteriales bacterium]MCB9205694.1 3-oxoacyl-[acyl-carrier-protein] reductase [Flavobacteriales bacterium]
MGLLDGKVALITGGTRGIGKGICQKFAAEGATVVFTYMSSDEKAKALQSELGEKSLAVRSDASKLDEAEVLIEQIVEKYGQLDVVVNNAGITRDNLLMRMKEEDWDEVIDTNLKSVFNVTKAVQRTMLKQRSGSIINITSVVGVQGNAGQANYAASKAGIIGFTKSIAKELGSRNIRCNAIAPGFIETEMTESLDEKVVDEWRKSIPLKRGGSPEDVANAAVFLASDLSSYVTGQTISVCGGMLT